MRGERIRTAAATVGALAAELSRDDLAVVAFWSDAAILRRLGQHVPPAVLLDTMLRIPAKGLAGPAGPRPAAPDRRLHRRRARPGRDLHQLKELRPCPLSSSPPSSRCPSTATRSSPPSPRPSPRCTKRTAASSTPCTRTTTG